MDAGFAWGPLISLLEAGESIVYPTSTLPALGCRPTPTALDKLFELKHRPADKPVSLAVLDLEQAADIVEVSEIAEQMVRDFPLGSITLLLAAKSQLDSRLGGDRIAVRPVAHPLARELVSRGGPLTATSANLSGASCERDCTRAAHSLGLSDEFAIPETTSGGSPSTLISLTPEVIVIREGVISAHRVERWSQIRS